MYCSAGRTINKGNPDLTNPIVKVQDLPVRSERKVVIFATGKMSDSNVFANGLFQNIYYLYLLAELLGYTSFFLFNERDEADKRPEFLKNIRILLLDDLVRHPIPVHMYLEIGMSINPSLRSYLKTLGARVVKLYLGNILNIDIETPTYYIHQNFAHHVVGNSDEIWVSPHYEMHKEYAGCLNHVPLDPDHLKIAAYVWEPFFLTKMNTSIPRWQPFKEGEPFTFLVMEPNISFQKSAFMPLLIAEAFYRANKSINFKVVIVNGNRYQQIPYSANCFLPRLDIIQDGKVEFRDRMDIISAIIEFPSAIPFLHNINNEYNYMLLEYLHLGFPAIHNAPTWKDAGYYYNEESIEEGVRCLAQAINGHVDNLDVFIGQARPIIYRHSIYNPKVQEAWKALLR